MPCNYSYLQENFYKRFDGAVSKTGLLKEFDNKVEGSSPNKTFFLLSQRCRIFLWFTCLQKKHVLMYSAHVKRLHSVKWRSFYGDTSYYWKRVQVLQGAKWRSGMKWNCHWIVYGTRLQHSLALADLPLRKLYKRIRRHRTSSNTVIYVECVTGWLWPGCCTEDHRQYVLLEVGPVNPW